MFVFYAIRSTGRMQSFKLLAFLGLFIVATVSADNTPRERRGLCVDAEIFALFSPTNQSLGVKEFNPIHPIRNSLKKQKTMYIVLTPSIKTCV